MLNIVRLAIYTSDMKVWIFLPLKPYRALELITTPSSDTTLSMPATIDNGEPFPGMDLSVSHARGGAGLAKTCMKPV